MQNPAMQNEMQQMMAAMSNPSFMAKMQELKVGRVKGGGIWGAFNVWLEHRGAACSEVRQRTLFVWQLLLLVQPVQGGTGPLTFHA